MSQRLMGPRAFAPLLFLGILPGAPLEARQDPPALEAFQRDVVMRLTGGSEIAPGLRLAERSSPESRTAARAYLAGLLESMGLDPQRQPYRENGENVFALLDATDPSDGVVVLGAHFDAAGAAPGASDNATGCALVLGVARDLVALPRRTKNVLIVFFDEEERGLVGSRAFAGKLADEGTRVVAVHTADQMGWDADGDRAIELELPYEGAEDLYQEAARTLGMTIPIHVTEETGSDHSAFRRLGMPAVGLTEEYRNGDTTPHIHRTTDTWDTVDFSYLAASTRLVAAALTALLR